MSTTIPTYVVPGQLICPLNEKIGKSLVRKYQAGNGTAIRNLVSDDGSVKAIVSTVVGKVNIRTIQEMKEYQESKGTYIVSVENKFKSSYTKSDNASDEYGINSSLNSTRSGTSGLPAVNDVVLARIIKLSLRQAHAEILVIEGQGTVGIDNGIGLNSTEQGVLGPAQSSGGSGNTGNTDIGEGFGAIIRLQDVRATERDKVKILNSFGLGDIVRAVVISLGDGTNYYLSTARNDLGVVFANSRVGELMYPIDWQTMKCEKTGEIENRKCAKPFY
ncbi:hypothetical protein NADFUDRAFT_56369 [Nadsonia fulvescens var. elongata DSM 6958]|uniref:Uncharacterized protein n=1 Tax=Nadsonia fulvescens var. elongata DSM 6958 TaxID=857566 RepID=A0A1E3PRJ9_9ASCO|nr:hypothetical protein NADFUDRAFT_56369 [Nadsonia fulvescens var. elongata DSM 6958]